ncbi:MAG: hypothetical protein J6B82_05665 [Bacteroidaceae bacterium]|nr:hypothetical protein [Bacteroidaceae bacterium]
METKKVYAVTSGEYSDYHIKGIFDSREKAEEYINYSTYSDLNDIEEYNLNEPPDKGEKIFEIRSDFENIDCKIVGDSPEPMMYKDLMHIMNFGLGDRKQYIYFYICADTRDRAIKIASERLRQVKAEEHFRFPMLRRLVGLRYYDSKVVEFPYIHYHTGEIVLPEGYTLGTITVPKDLEPHVKVITMEELAARYKKEEPE